MDTSGLGYGIGAGTLLGFFLALLIYFIPTIIVMVTRHRSATPIVLLNLFAGWLLIPWIIALVWSLRR